MICITCAENVRVSFSALASIFLIKSLGILIPFNSVGCFIVSPLVVLCITLFNYIIQKMQCQFVCFDYCLTM